MTLKECMKKKKPYMVHEEAIGCVSRTTRDGAAHGQVFAHTAGISQCLLRTIYRSNAATVKSAVCHS